MRHIGTRAFLGVLLLAGAPALGQAPAEDEDEWSELWEEEWQDTGPALPWTGFVEGAAGLRFDDVPGLDRATLGEVRSRFEKDGSIGDVRLAGKADVGLDAVLEEVELDLRELSAGFRLGRDVDVILGRQVLTWGTGDYLFLNDLFPKDWQSFFAGRDDEYLKAPSDTVRVSWFTDLVNVDLAWTPLFEPDRYIDGERFAFFFPPANGGQGAIIAPDPPLGAVLPDEKLGNGEWALRLYRNVRGTELAFYGYRGYWKSPNGLTPSFLPTFRELSVYGASARMAALGGLVNVETAWYESREDDDGTDPLVPNDQWRFLAGYERELVTNLTVSGQLYLEWTRDHDRLLANSPNPRVEPEERRTLVTVRATWLTRQNTLIWSLFAFLSPSDDDFYVRPRVEYRYSDNWSFAAGANVFGGEREWSFFGQFEDASNVWARVRFSY
jgi:hypothetical protein